MTFRITLDPRNPLNQPQCKNCANKTTQFQKITSYRLGLLNWSKEVYCKRLKTSKSANSPNNCEHYARDTKKRNKDYEIAVQKEYDRKKFVSTKDYKR